MDVLVHDDSLLRGANKFMAANRPTLDEIVGAACELYRIDPDELEQLCGIPARRVYAFMATRWSCEAAAKIGDFVGMSYRDVQRMTDIVEHQRQQDHLMRDDLDLMTMRIAERVILRKRNWGQPRR